MNFREVITKVRGLISVKKKTRSYLIYGTIIIAILGIIGIALQNRENAKLVQEKAALEQLNEDRARANGELNAQLEDLSVITERAMEDVAMLRRAEDAGRAEVDLLEEELTASKAESSVLEAQLEHAHENLAGTELKNSFLAEQIVAELYNYFPTAGHVFFSETQETLFRTNPETANLIYTVITENAVRVQLITQLGGQITALTEQVEAVEGIVTLRGEEIIAYENLTVEFNETFDNLEAALSLERRTVSNLERQIAIMNRKNLFEKILPSLNVVIGPYYDPFRNQGGFAIALGLGWRF